MSQEAGQKKEVDERKVWLDAWYDPLACVCTFNGTMVMGDLNGDGDYKLVVAVPGQHPLSKMNSSSNYHKLKVFKGTTLVSENVLLAEPIAAVVYYQDYKMPRRPIVAVACVNFIFLFKNLQPFFKFELPQEKSEEESQIQDSITCMSVLRKDREEEDSVGSIVVGTEKKSVLILDPSGSVIKVSTKLPDTPCFLATSGLFDVDYRVVVACRNGNVYTIRNGELSGIVIELEAQPCGLVKLEKNIAIGMITNEINCYHPKGKKLYSIYLPASINCMEVLEMKAFRNVKAMIVSLSNMELRIYNGKILVNVIKTTDVVVGMKFGIYGTEPNVLALSYRNGALEFKIVARKSKLEIRNDSGPPSEQEEPLNIPKKTRLYIDQIEREKQFATDMHRIFQHELCKLRVTTARTVVKMLTENHGTISYTISSSVRLHAHVQGLGPQFKIRFSVQNTGQKPIFNLPVVFTYNPELYKMEKSRIIIPCLIPSLQYNFSADVSSIEDSQYSDVIKLFVCNPSSTVPLITATLEMPVTMR